MIETKIILISMAIIILLIIGILTFYIIKYIELLLIDYGLDEKIKIKFESIYYNIIEGDSNDRKANRRSIKDSKL